MHPQMSKISLLAIIVISFVSIHTISSIEQPYNDYTFEEEEFFGHNDSDFGHNDQEPYPTSYLSTEIEDTHFSDSKLKSGLMCFNKCMQDLGVNLDQENLQTNLAVNLDQENLQTNLAATKTVSVDSFGAKGDGKTDDSKAFQKAWKNACSSRGGATFVVPKSKTYLLKPIIFKGPCTSNVIVKVYGRIKASGNRSDFQKNGRLWLRFDSVKNLVVEGGGVINGNGKTWWQNSCKTNPKLPCKVAPTALHFYNTNNLRVRNMRIENGQQLQVSIEKSKNVQLSNVVVSSPESSPNTDGIHITATQDIILDNCDIATGDDCISIEAGTSNLRANDITCGPGHGISIGSLGSDASTDYVSNVVVNGAKLSGTTNGVRIKTYQGGHGRAGDIKFYNIQMDDVANPIIIDQNYCDREEPCGQQKAAVQVENVEFKNIKGTSSTKVAIKFDCSQNHPCKGILLQDVNLKRTNGDEAQALCNNVGLKVANGVKPRCPSNTRGVYDQ